MTRLQGCRVAGLHDCETGGRWNGGIAAWRNPSPVTFCRKDAVKKGLIIIGVLAILLILWWAGGTGRSHYPITNLHPAGSRVIAFGDSLTAGRGTDSAHAYPAVLAKRLGIPILNKGISGDTTADGLRRLHQDVLSMDPKMVLLELGANDFLQKRNQDVTFENLRQMIVSIQKTGALVILLYVNFPLGGSYTRRYRQLAQQTGCPQVPDLLGGLLGHRALMSDGVHPNARGYAKMVDRIEPVVRFYLSEASASSASGSMAGSAEGKRFK